MSKPEATQKHVYEVDLPVIQWVLVTTQLYYGKKFCRTKIKVLLNQALDVYDWIDGSACGTWCFLTDKP